MSGNDVMSVGFTDPVHDTQQVFRHALDALSRPGTPFTLATHVSVSNLGPAMAQLLLTLTDDDTTVWWQHDDALAADWLRFHTGAKRSNSPVDAAFAVLSSVTGLPALSSFAVGSAEAPEHSTTLLLEVASFDTGPAIECRGPGIRGVQTVCIAGLPENFWMQWQANHVCFPQGVDIIFTCANAILGLPRTTRVRRMELI